MFVRQNQQQFRNSNADVQIFYGDGRIGSGFTRTWNKPPDVSHVYIMCIGSGANNTSATFGGGSGAVTVWYGAAQNVPDTLCVGPDGSNLSGDSRVGFRNTAGTVVVLLQANSTSNINGGNASTANTFAASGFFQSVAGQSGSASGIAASTTTFLSGGGDGAYTQTSNYGYASGQGNGFFQLQPIIVGAGGMGTGNGGLGCGAGAQGGVGGQGMVLIASW